MINIAKINNTEVIGLQKTCLFENIFNGKDRWLEIAIKKHKNNILYSTMEKDTVDKILQDVGNKKELEWLMSRVPDHSKHILKFTHTDMLAGNIMKLKDDSIKFIDFEYAAYTYPGFDVAEFLLETNLDYDYEPWPRFKYNHDRSMINEDISSLCLYYIFGEEFKNDLGSHNINDLIDSEEKVTKLLYSKIGKESLEKKINEFRENVHIGYLFALWYWLVWSIINAKSETTDFGYVDYSYDRYIAYKKIKAEMLNQE